MALKQRLYGSIYYSKENDQWVIDKLEPQVCIRIKNVFKQINVTDIVPFKLKNKLDTAADLKWFMERYPLAINKTDRELLYSLNENFYQELSKRERILLPNYKSKKKYKLVHPYEARPYQAQAVELHELVKRFLLGDELGLGKTLTATLPLLKHQPGLVVVPTHLVTHWKEKLTEYTDLDYHIINGRTPYELPPAAIYIIKYGCVAGWVDVLTTGYFKYAVFDEAQELRRKESNRYDACYKISESVEYTMGLSATPQYNYGDEIFNIMDLLKPGCLGTYSEFLTEWCSFSGKHVIINDPRALGAYLRESHLFLRRVMEDVGIERVKINTLVYNVDYDEAAAAEVEDEARMLALKVVSGSFTERGQAARDLDIMMREQTGVAKVKSSAAIIKMLLDSGKPVLVGAWHRKVWEMLMHELRDYKPLLYTGSETGKQKDKNVKKFMSGETKCLFMSLRSGTGLDGMQHVCNTVVYVELDWSPKVHDQFTGRSARPGQVDEVTAIYTKCNYGSDPLIASILGIKASQAHGIINPYSDPLEQVSDDSRIKQLAQRILNGDYTKQVVVDEEYQSVW